MNIQLRKIHLPPFPEVNANALVQLTESSGSLTSVSSPVGISSSKSRFNLDEIILDIENNRTENITPLEWIHCIYNKGKWDTKNKHKSISTSQAIWKAAEQNSWLKQKLFWNLVLHSDKKNILASSLVSNYTIFCPQDSLDGGRLAIIEILQEKYPNDNFIKRCWLELLTPSQLLNTYQLPTKITASKASYDYVVPQFSISDNINSQQVEWLLKCLKEMSQEQQLRAVEYLLIKVDYKVGAEHTKLIDWLRKNYGSSINNSRWNELSNEAKAAMRKWLGAVSYQDFQRLANLILNRVTLKSWEHRRLRDRSKFWSNYSDRFKRIRILLPQSSANILNSYLSHQDVSILKEDGSNPTEVCIFDFGDWFIVEFFRGDGSETRIFVNTSDTERILFNSSLSIQEIRASSLNSDTHDHKYLWQYFCEKLLREKKGILPNEGVTNFEGLYYPHNQYNAQTGLPKPSYDRLEKREDKLRYWREKIDELEEEAEDYMIM